MIDQITNCMTTIIRSEDIVERIAARNSIIYIFSERFLCNDDKAFRTRNKLMDLIKKAAETKNPVLRSLRMIRASKKLTRFTKCDISVKGELDAVQSTIYKRREHI